MTDPKDDLPETDSEIPVKEPTPEPGIETPAEGIPEEGEEETIRVGLETASPSDPAAEPMNPTRAPVDPLPEDEDDLEMPSPTKTDEGSQRQQT